MKYLVALSFLVSIVLNLNAQDSILVIEANYQNSFESPRLAFKGDVLKVETDSLFLVTTERMNFYKKLHLNARQQTCESLLSLTEARYEKALLEADQQYTLLKQNCDKADQLTIDILSSTKQSLQQTDRTLELSQVSLKHATDNLGEVNKILQNERKKTLLDKLLIGAGGVGIGILVGLLVNN